MSARRRLAPLADYLHGEAAGGIVLLIAAVGALAWANSPISDSYFDLWQTHLDLGIDLSLQHWVNDGLMALFFFVVGLEIKRELVVGELSEPRAALLPALAAAAGVALPVLLFFALTAGTDAADGWAVPAATDIAFAVGILAVLGVVVAMRTLGVGRIAWYVLPAFALWIAVHESGVHATIAGVALGLLTPTGSVRGRNVLELLEHRLHPWSAFVVVPLFALANAGVDFGGGVLSGALGSTLTWAVVVGLLVGKPVGIAGATWVALRLRVGALPDGVAFRHVVGAGALGGIGFTVSIFIAGLAFEAGPMVDDAKVGIFLGSIASAVLGAVLLVTLARRGPSRG
jgi:NhaA family Na+:H+ antiporter